MNKKNIRSLRKKFKEEDIANEYLEDENLEEDNNWHDNFDENSFFNSPSIMSKEIVDDDEEEDLEDEDIEEELINKIETEVFSKKPKAPKEKFYVEPKKFDEEIMKYYDSGEMSDELASMVSKIANKLSYASNFVNYTYREEMVGDGIVRMFKALMSKKYDREKGTNPFSYFTRIAFNAFRNRIKKEKHIHEAHEKYQQEYMMVSEGYNNLLKNNQIKIMKEIERKYYE
jgi:triphosphoribosyl-dephospho-CoA synthetase